jgi:hypothetical protein
MISVTHLFVCLIYWPVSSVSQSLCSFSLVLPGCSLDGYLLAVTMVPISHKQLQYHNGQKSATANRHPRKKFILAVNPSVSGPQVRSGPSTCFTTKGAKNTKIGFFLVFVPFVPFVPFVVLKLLNQCKAIR